MSVYSDPELDFLQEKGRGIAETLRDEFPADAFPGVQPGVIRIRPRRILSYVDGVRNDRSVT